MSHHAPKIDLGSKLFFVASLVAILLTVYVLVSSLIHTFQKNMTKGEVDSTEKLAFVADELKPIGASSTSDAPPPSAKGKSGKEVYAAVCHTCHETGVLQAPKFGDKAAWKPRVAMGLDALMTSATKGKGSMPARGGNPALSDAEIKNAIIYMTKKAGFDLGGTAKAEKPATTPRAKEPSASKEPSAVKEPEPSAKNEQQPASKEQRPQKSSGQQVNTSQPAETMPPAAKPENTTKEATPTVVATAEKTAAAAPAIDGKKIYEGTCFACHATGVAGSPVFGNKELWAPRIATGKDALYHSAINGKNAMPPKGGNPTLAEDQIKAAVDYMVSQSQ